MLLSILLLIGSAFLLVWATSAAARVPQLPDLLTKVIVIVVATGLATVALWGAHVALN